MHRRPSEKSRGMLNGAATLCMFSYRPSFTTITFVRPLASERACSLADMDHWSARTTLVETTTRGRHNVRIGTLCIATGRRYKDKKGFLSAVVSKTNEFRWAATRLRSFFPLHQPIFSLDSFRFSNQIYAIDMSISVS